jgi:phosphatidylserine/phosphatidylglycerophosphate/cardiolipin synthase-like enzyme
MMVREWALLLALLCSVDPARAEEFPVQGEIQLAFSPEQDAAGLIVRTLRDAKKQILVQAFSLTNKSIAHALIAARRRGVTVEVLCDRGQFERGNAYLLADLKQAGVRVLLDGDHEAAHNKVMIIDPTSAQSAVITGSFNFTQAAQKRNAENVLILRGNAALAKAYLDNWERHRSHSSPLD